MKIENLTKEQVSRFPEFIKRWTDIGLCTDPANRPEAEKGIKLAYEIAGLKSPRIVWTGSPMSQGLTRAIVFGLKDSEVKIGASVRDSVGDSVRDSVWASVRDSVRDSVGASVGDSVWASVGDSVRDSVWASGYGQHDANWLGFYEYFKLACSLEKETQKLCGLWQIAQHAGWWLPHQNLCWSCERHNVLHRNERGQLHKDGAMALAYPDGWGIYALNGVRMKPEHILTPGYDLDPKAVLKETNVDIRRELIRKMGVERMPHKVLNKQGDYELWSVALTPEIKDARYLKMLNPSIGVWHVEGVDPSCKTVQEAINWRAGNINDDWQPEVLT